MKHLLAGMACAVSLTLGAATGAVSQKAMQSSSMCGSLGAMKFYMGLGVAFAHRTVKLTSAAKTTFNAGYIFAPPEVAPFTGSFYTPMLDAGGAVSAVAQDGSVGFGVATARAAYAVVYGGAVPKQWRVGGANVAATKAIMQDAMLDLTQAALPTNKAWVADADREATSSVVTTLDHGSWGIRLQGGIGYNLMDELVAYCMLTYKIEFDQASSGNTQTVSFATQGKAVNFSAAAGNANLSSNLVLASFGYNDNNILSDVKVKVKIAETFGIMGGLEWKPVENMSIFANIGAKRYVVDVSYSGGDVAYPGTDTVYTKSFLEKDGKTRRLVTQDGVTRKWSATEWPLAFGGGVNFVFCGRHNAQIGLEYSTFDVKLGVARDTNGTPTDDKKGLSVEASDPCADHAFAAKDFKNGYGVHQFAAKEVVNTLSVTKLEVSDFTLFGGYMLTL